MKDHLRKNTTQLFYQTEFVIVFVLNRSQATVSVSTMVIFQQQTEFSSFFFQFSEFSIKFDFYRVFEIEKFVK